MTNYQTLAALFEANPFTTAMILLLVLATLLSACVALYVSVCALHDLLSEKRRERLHDAALAQQMQPR